jgi:Xaa-Pro aminopeptidase
MVDSLMAIYPTLYTLTAAAAAGDEPLSREQQVVGQIARTGGATRIVPLANALDLLRARTSTIELDLIRRATQITVLAHREAMRSVEPGMNEFEMHALVEYYFRRNGAERPSFSSIVASGPNSTTLHYRSADRVMRAEELLLVDIGASYRGYAADVTRTYPVDGSFSDDQRAIYQVVLDAQRAAEGRVRVGGSWAEASATANTVIATGLTRLGLIDAPNATYSCDSPRTSNECPQYRLYYMHSLGHGVGLEVHDPDVSYFGPFEVGSVITLEPGIYVRDDVLSYLRDSPQNRAMIERLRPAVTRYAGIGVRIEDLYVVTATGLEWLSRGAPREIDEIEALMADTGLGQYERRREVVEWYPLTSLER